MKVDPKLIFVILRHANRATMLYSGLDYIMSEYFEHVKLKKCIFDDDAIWSLVLGWALFTNKWGWTNQSFSIWISKQFLNFRRRARPSIIVIQWTTILQQSTQIFDFSANNRSHFDAVFHLRFAYRRKSVIFYQKATEI